MSVLRFVPAPLATSLSIVAGPPHPYPLGLTPIVSPFCPHCLAHDRLRLWVPTTAFSRLDHVGLPVPVSDDNLDHILAVVSHAHMAGTRETYGSGLLVYHVFCDVRGITKEQQCPASPLLLLAFISACAGLYVGTTLENYFYAIHTWHLIHGIPWCANQAEHSLALAGAACLAPPASKCPKCAPFTVQLLSDLCSVMDLLQPLQVAVFACLTTSFFTIARTGEFMVPSLTSFNPHIHVKVSDIRHDEDCNDFKVVVFGLPHTKTFLTGEDVYWAAQSGTADLQAALQNHLAINNPPLSAALFSWRHRGGL